MSLDSDLQRVRGTVTLKVTGQERFREATTWAEVPPSGGLVGRAEDAALYLERAPRRISRSHCVIQPGEGPWWTVTDLSSHGTSIRVGRGTSSPLDRSAPIPLPDHASLVLARVVELVVEIVRAPPPGEPTEDSTSDGTAFPRQPNLPEDLLEFARQITAPWRKTPPTYRAPSLFELSHLRGESERNTRRYFEKLAAVPEITGYLTLDGAFNDARRSEIAGVLTQLMPQLRRGSDGQDTGN